MSPDTEKQVLFYHEARVRYAQLALNYATTRKERKIARDRVASAQRQLKAFLETRAHT